MDTLDLTGLHVALATPFRRDGALDLPALKRLVRHVAGGADVLIALGTTGEATALTEAERDAVIATCLEESPGKPVLVGTGSNSTAVTCALTQRAQALGAQGALVVTPYYVKPTQAGIVAHLNAVADAAPGLPIVAYNVPGRTGVNIEPATVARLWANPGVVAIKESSGNMAQISAIAREVPPGRLLLAGDDAMAWPTIAAGGHGVVSVLGNLLPGLMRQLVDTAREGRVAAAAQLHQRLLPAMNAVMAESNPIPTKAGLELLGLGTDRVRLPLLPAADSTRRLLAGILTELGALDATRATAVADDARAIPGAHS